MQISKKGGYGEAIAKLERFSRIHAWGREWAIYSARYLDMAIRHHLATQGRGGAPPPLSEITRRIYQVSGEPDGSGIHNHLEIFIKMQDGDRVVAGVGIPQGKPTLVARVQEYGAVIPVTDRMRKFFAANYGIGFSASTTHLVVPGRQFWSDSILRTKIESERRLAGFFEDLLK